ncbi:MAG: urease accessory protein UreH [Chloroflexi bacterium]|jgi:ABC-type nickel/cobalt efflux system permease component RcnA|nr:urease accessory protein UreH [Chloroflexota bacterium]MBT7082018.1 urease accessory protein UreH [Chloroflexota bacterium]MBT7289689.1 urease accessory protein UreH [Chloroflexota bacterium]
MTGDVNILSALLLGGLLGLKHAMDPDHVVVVTTIVSRNRSILRSMLAGLTWGIGHTIVLFTVGFGVLFLKISIPDKLALGMEFCVGILLVVLGIPLLWKLIKRSKTHVHVHEHADSTHVHFHSHTQQHTNPTKHKHTHLKRSLLIGMLHGMAGSGALMVLVLGTMSNAIEGLYFLLVFGVGSILGMMVFSSAISLPFKLATSRSLKLNLWLQGIAGCISIVLGILIMVQTGIVDGLFDFS